jgi:putative nucleotidyltransferase with HDIG domain
LLLRILRVVDGERASAKDLVELMQRDQALAGRVLRLANSGFFACSREVATLSRAVMLLGFSTVKNLALGIKIWETMASRGGPAIASLWAHSALVGAAARLIAQRTRAAEPEEVFTAGLLHDVGRVVLALRFPAEYASLVSGVAARYGVAPPIEDRERAVFGIDHAQAGAWLVDAWQLPRVIVDAIAHHHDAVAVETPLGPATIVNLANALVHWTDLDGGAIDPEAERRLASVAGGALSLASWVEIAAMLQGQKGDLRAFFGSES